MLFETVVETQPISHVDLKEEMKEKKTIIDK